MGRRSTRLPFGKQKILDRDGYSCQYCGKDTTGVDHIRPYSFRVDNGQDNLVACCNRCNSIAGNLLFHDFIDKQLYILKKLEKMGVPVCAPKTNIVPENKDADKTSSPLSSCPHCGKTLRTVRRNNKFCSTNCGRAYRKKKEEAGKERPTPKSFGFFHCEYCGVESPQTKVNQKFCNNICKGAYWREWKDVAKTLAFHKRLIDKLKNDIESLEQRVRELESK